MVRVDEEVTDSLSSAAQRTVRAAVRSQTAKCPVLALQDHNKGVLSDTNVPDIIADARKTGCKVIVDPALISDYRHYRGATLLTPNRYEAALASGVEIVGADQSALERAGRQILMTTDAEMVMITLDRDGIFLLGRDGAGRRFPARPRSVADGTGAGDVVLATMAVALGAGCDYADALSLANVAAGLEVERFGVVPVTREEILDELHRMLGLRGGKVVTRKDLAREITRRRGGGETIVFTNGCFDLLHAGHVRYLRQARELGSCLIVAINSDDSVRRLKGPDRPVIGADERAEMLGALECVDYVTVFEEDTPEPLLEMLEPDILAKGGTTPVVVGAEIVESYGGKVLTLDMVKGASTTEIINRIVNTTDEGQR
jgi:D-beta-D-heptose 7-phosphate kinase/D-beta-D-heptose 1-phosphate adenosyltransferase